VHAFRLGQADPVIPRLDVRLGRLRLRVARDEAGDPVRVTDGEAEGGGATLGDADEGVRGADVQVVEEEGEVVCEVGYGTGRQGGNRGEAVAAMVEEEKVVLLRDEVWGDRGPKGYVC